MTLTEVCILHEIRYGLTSYIRQPDSCHIMSYEDRNGEDELDEGGDEEEGETVCVMDR